MKATPDRIAENLALCRVDPLTHFETCVKIEDKQKRRVKPKANVFQRRLFQAYLCLLPIALKLGIQIRILGLKIRQCGGTTASCHLIYHHSQRYPTESVVFANIKDNSQAMLAKIKLFSETDLLPDKRPINPKRTTLEWSNTSQCEITSADAPNAGISRTRQFGLFSEAAKYPRGGVKDDKSIMAGALPSLSGDGTIAIAETTGEGASGWFYEQYHGTKDMPGALTLDQFLDELAAGNMCPGNGWVKVFAAWFEFEENVEPVNEAQRKFIDATLTPREFNGRQKYGWTHEQIQWRRATMKSECGGSEDLFDEYYPEDEISCFLTSGRPRFNMASLVAMERHANGYAWEKGNLTMQENGTVTFAEQIGGFAPIHILERPLPGCRYIVACDPATGEDQTESADPDRTSILVLRAGYSMGDVVKPTRVVARVRPPFNGEADEVGKYIEALSRYYGDATVVLEINMGLHVLEHLKTAGVPLYKREIIDQYDRDAERFAWGWKLKDRDQRRTVIDCLAIAIRDGSIDLADLHLIGEAKTFVWAKNGREEAREGTHDDDVLACAMGLYCIGSATLYKGQSRKRQTPKDFRDWKKWR